MVKPSHPGLPTPSAPQVKRLQSASASPACALLALSQTLLCGAAGNAKEVEQCGAQKLNLGPAKGPKPAGGAIGLDSRGPARRGKLPKAAEVLVKDEPPARPREQGGNADCPLRLELRKESAFVITTSHGPWPRFS